MGGAQRLLIPLLIGTLTVQLFGVILLIEEVNASPAQSELIKVALTKNVAPRSDWGNGTIYHLKILQKFIPIDITIITSFTSLSDYQVLFLNLLNMSDADITAIVNWVNSGGFLVCIGQSGRYTETGAERASHPLATVLGVTLNDWGRRSGVEVRMVVTSVAWHWWGSGRVYDLASGGDAVLQYPDRYYIPKSECVHITPEAAMQKMACRDADNSYETAFVTYSTYGSGKAFFIAADPFYRIVWKPPNIMCGLDDSSKFISGGEYLRRGLLWQILYAMFLDFFPNTPIPIITSMPYGFYTAMSFYLTGYDDIDLNNDTQDDLDYANLTRYWKPLFDSYPELKGWFWGFAFPTRIINGTSNATNICNFVKEYGYVGSRGHERVFDLEDYKKSSDNLQKHNFNSYRYGLMTPLDLQQDIMIPLVSDWNFLKFVHIKRISADRNFGAEISCIPYPNSDHTWNVLSFVGGYAREPWRNLIERQKTLGQNYGIGGFCTGTSYDYWIGMIQPVREAINTFIDDSTVWKTNETLFHNWWINRWKVNITDYSASSTQIIVKLQTPNIHGLTLLLKGITNNIRDATIDGTSVTHLAKNNRLTIPELLEGVHDIVIEFGHKTFSTTELEAYNAKLKTEGRPYVTVSTNTITHLNFTHQRLSANLDVSTGITTQMSVYSPYPPRQVFADHTPMIFTYTIDIATFRVRYAYVDIYYAQPKITAFTSSKQDYGPAENVELALTVYGDYSTSETIKWLVKLTIKDQTEKAIKTVDQELELNKAENPTLNFNIGALAKGTYTMTAEILDSETGNILGKSSLTITVVTEAPIPLPWYIFTVIVTAIIGVAVYAWYQRRKR